MIICEEYAGHVYTPHTVDTVAGMRTVITAQNAIVKNVERK